MACPPVCGEIPRALASGLYRLKMDNNGISILTSFVSVCLAHYEIVGSKVDMGGLKLKIRAHRPCT